MKRAHMVIAGTVVGLAGLLSFNSSAVQLSLGSLSAVTVPPRSTTTTTIATTTTSAPRTRGATTPTTPPTTTPTAPPTTTTAPPATRSATGASSNYSYGILSVKVTVSGSKITNISIASINDGGNPRSQFIDQQSIPLLEQEALSAQSANIQGVSGASYTTAGFEQSLQSALTKLGV